MIVLKKKLLPRDKIYYVYTKIQAILKNLYNVNLLFSPITLYVLVFLQDKVMGSIYFTHDNCR